MTVKKIAAYITDQLILKTVIDKNEQEIYQFGLEQLLSGIFNAVSIMIIGLLFMKPIECLIIMIAFTCLRMYAGGYHAPTPKKCYLVTVFSIIASLSAIKYVEISVLCCAVILIISGAVILVLSPVDTQNKPLDDMEKMIYRKKAFCIWGIEAGCAILGIFFHINVIALGIMSAHAILAISLIIGSLQNYESLIREKM